LAERQGKFIGFIEPYDHGWRASFRTLMPGAVFSEEGHYSEVFTKDADAVKWLHTQARRLGFSSIEIRNKATLPG
jgi:hypothetical protein